MNYDTQRLPSGAGRAARLALCLCCALTTSPAIADLTVVEGVDNHQNLTVFKMTVTPAAEPTPTFKYRLTPGPLELRPGNAALHYMRAFAESGLSSRWKHLVEQYGDDVDGRGENPAWYETKTPLKDLPIDSVRSAAASFDTVIEQSVERAVIRDDCDWGRNIEELRGLDIISLLLPEAQESRSLARALMLRTRVAVADRDFERAIAQLRMTYRMGQHVASDPILVCGLVGIAEASIANMELVELIAAPDSPNLYWALAELQRPLVDLRPAVRYELQWGLRIFPILSAPEQEEHSPQEWGRLIAQAFADMESATGIMPQSELVLPQGKLDLLQTQLAAIAMVAYPDAKQRLIDGGMDAERVERMPVGQVLAVDASREFQQMADSFGKGCFMPAPQGLKHFENAEEMFAGNKFAGGFGRVMGGLLLPALGNVLGAQVRLERQLDALLVVEAIRMHAADQGKLPASLEEIAVVPVPVNPVTGKPFDYRLDGATAVLELPLADGVRDAWRFEITLAQ